MSYLETPVVLIGGAVSEIGWRHTVLVAWNTFDRTLKFKKLLLKVIEILCFIK
jgi:hypothetical protein